jgi:hypothetical protein
MSQYKSLKTIHIKFIIKITCTYVSLQNLNPFSEFEPGSSVPQADTMMQRRKILVVTLEHARVCRSSRIGTLVVTLEHAWGI